MDDELFLNLPPKLTNKLLPFQKEGVKFAVHKNGRCLIADEMGLGKTLQAISVAYYYKSEWPMLIIVPSSLRYCWIEEFEKWLPDISPSDINLVQTGNDVSEIAHAKVTITTFGLLSKTTSRILKEALNNQAFQVVIVDESHYVRNIKTVSAKTVVPLIKNANRRILLSGTPALARPVELYPQIDAVCPGKFGSWWSYTARYCDAKLEWFGKNKRRNVNGASNLQELQQILSSTLMIRREKNQVLTQLPPKQRQKILFELKDSNLKKEIRETFDELRPMLKRGSGDKFEVLTGGGEHGAVDTNMLSLVSRLYMLTGEAKIGPAKEYIEMLCENQKLKFLVFAYHHAMMIGLSESLHDKHVKFIRIDGETPQSERPHLVHQFQSDPDTRVAVLSILAAGVGLTLTAATVVVFAEMYWTPGVMVQCEDRAHRIGQNSCVAVHYLVAKNTMDDWVWSAVCKKTIVTSTTLTGHKRELKAEAGYRYQVDVLSNADVWVPSENLDSTAANNTLIQSLQTQVAPDQPSILDFFSSQSSKQGTRTPKFRSPATPKSNLLKMLDGAESESVITIDDETNRSPVRKRKRFSELFKDINGHGDKFDAESEPKKRKTSKPSVGKTSINKNTKESNRLNKRPIVVIDSDDGDDDFASAVSPLSLFISSRRKGENAVKSKTMVKSNIKSISNGMRVIDDSDEQIEIDDQELNDDSEDNGSAVQEISQKGLFDKELNQTPSMKRKSSKEMKLGDRKTDTGIKADTDIENSESADNTTPSKGTNGRVEDNVNSGPTKPVASCSGIHNAGQWNCHMCTFLNHQALNYCEMCESPKQKVKFVSRRKLDDRGTKSFKDKIADSKGSGKATVANEFDKGTDEPTDVLNESVDVLSSMGSEQSGGKTGREKGTTNHVRSESKTSCIRPCVENSEMNFDDSRTDASDEANGNVNDDAGDQNRFASEDLVSDPDEMLVAEAMPDEQYGTDIEEFDSDQDENINENSLQSRTKHKSQSIKEKGNKYGEVSRQESISPVHSKYFNSAKNGRMEESACKRKEIVIDNTVTFKTSMRLKGTEADDEGTYSEALDSAIDSHEEDTIQEKLEISDVESDVEMNENTENGKFTAEHRNSEADLGNTIVEHKTTGRDHRTRGHRTTESEHEDIGNECSEQGNLITGHRNTVHENTEKTSGHRNNVHENTEKTAGHRNIVHENTESEKTNNNDNKHSESLMNSPQIKDSSQEPKVNVTPTGSVKKYRFKSVRKKNLGSPVGSPVTTNLARYIEKNVTVDSERCVDNEGSNCHMNSASVKSDVDTCYENSAIQANKAVKNVVTNECCKSDSAFVKYNTSNKSKNREIQANKDIDAIDECDKTDNAFVKYDTSNKSKNREIQANKDINVVDECHKSDNVEGKEVNETPTKTGRGLDYSFSSPEMDLVAAAQDMEKSAVKDLSPEKRIVDIGSLPVYSVFRFLCSKYTGRIYLLDIDNAPLDVNFVPLDVELENLDALPDLLLQPSNMKLVQKFVREWTSLSETKQRLLVKSRQPFISPILEYDRLKSCKTINVQRYKTKADISSGAKKAVGESSGTVRLLSKKKGVIESGTDSEGLAQVVSEDGTPHCIQCQKPYQNSLLTDHTIQKEENAWYTRFCSLACSHQYWILFILAHIDPEEKNPHSRALMFYDHVTDYNNICHTLAKCEITHRKSLPAHEMYIG